MCLKCRVNGETELDSQWPESGGGGAVGLEGNAVDIPVPLVLPVYVQAPAFHFSLRPRLV